MSRKRDRRPPEQLSKDELRERIIRRAKHVFRRAKHVFRESEQAIIDGEYWNGLPHNQQYTPMDLEDFRLSRAWAQKVLKRFGICPRSRL